MVWTYNSADLNTSTASGRLNAVRYLVGDTQETDPQVQDEEILFALSENGDKVYKAASYVANTIAAKYARLVTTELDGQLNVKYSDLADKYKALAAELSAKDKSKTASLGVSAGGLTVENSFSRYQFENPVDEVTVITWE